MDIFEDLKDWEGIYQINRLGEIKSIANGRNRKTGYILKQSALAPSGYKVLILSKYGQKNILKYVHRLLAIQFIPNPENKYSVDHIDINPKNNSLDNLRWATQKEQCNNKSNNVTKEQKKANQSIRLKKIYHWRKISAQFRQILLE
jgi:hypothetical protein